MLIRDNPALPPIGQAHDLAAEVVVEAALWAVLDRLGSDAAASALVADAIDLASRRYVVGAAAGLADAAATELSHGGVPVASFGSGRIHAHDRGGRLGRAVLALADRVRAGAEAAAEAVDLARRAPAAAAEAYHAVRRERAAWYAAHPRWAAAITAIRALWETTDTDDLVRAAVAAVRAAIELDSVLPPPPPEPAAKPADILAHLSACDDAMAWAQDYATPAEAWQACPRGDWMLWYLRAVGVPVPAELRDTACPDDVRRHFPTPPLPAVEAPSAE